MRREPNPRRHSLKVGLSVGLGFALLIMGMDIDLQEVLQVIK